MSLLGNQTNITQKDFFFLLANVSTLTANNIKTNSISTGSITAGEAEISTLNTFFVSTGFLEADSISSLNLEANYTEFSTSAILFGNISSIVTNNITLDGNTIDTGGAGFGAVLLLNGLPIATGTSSLSSIQDWSFFPALSTLQMIGNNIDNAGNITCQNIYNALAIQTDTMSALTSLTAPSGVITNLRTSNLSTVNLVASNVTVSGGVNGGSFTGGVGRFTGMSSLSVSTGTINGVPYTPGSNWSQYPATSAVNMNGFDIAGGSQPAFTITATSNMTQTAGQSYCNIVDRGIDATGAALLSLNAKNGLQGSINIQADPGIAGIFGRVDITANGGTTGGIGTGGLININANTPLGFSNATSAVKINAAGINSYAGLVPSIGSLAGYNFIYGTNGVNITSGIPSIFPNIPFTTYLYGTAGIVLNSDVYTSAIYPYWDGVSPSNGDLLISGRVVNLVNQVYVNLSNVKFLDMDFFAQIRGVKGINFCNTYGSNYISNADVITGSNSISGYASMSAVTGGFTTLNATTVNGSNINASNITASNTLSTTALNISSINGFNMSQIVNSGVTTNRFSTLFTSTLAFSTMTSVGSNTAFNFPIVLDYDHAGASTANSGVAIAIQGHNFGTGALVNRIEMGARANGENYIMSVWPGQNLEELVIDATDVNFRDSDGFSTIINQNPFGVATNGVVRAPLVSSFSMTTSTINGQVLPYAYGSFTANTTQTVITSNVATPANFDTTEIASGITLANVSSIQVNKTGVYRILGSPQFDKSGGGTSLAYFWLTKNGSNVPRTNSQMTVQGNNGEVFASVEFLQYLSTGEAVGISFASSDNTMALTAYPETAFAPSTPALIFNINQLTS